MVWKGNVAASCASSTNQRLLLVLIPTHGSAHAHLLHTSRRVYTYSRLSWGPMCTVSISTSIPGLAGSGRSGYVCHFFHCEKRESPQRLSTRFTEERLTLTPSFSHRQRRI